MPVAYQPIPLKTAGNLGIYDGEELRNQAQPKPRC